jgi:hypothetical protein
MQADAEELLRSALATLAANQRFVAAFTGDDGRSLRARVRRIAEHVADRSEGNACRELITGLFRLLDDDVWDSASVGAGCGVQERRKRTATGEWPLVTAASDEQLQQQRAITQRLRSLEQVRRGGAVVGESRGKGFVLCEGSAFRGGAACERSF